MASTATLKYGSKILIATSFCCHFHHHRNNDTFCWNRLFCLQHDCFHGKITTHITTTKTTTIHRITWVVMKLLSLASLYEVFSGWAQHLTNALFRRNKIYEIFSFKLCCSQVSSWDGCPGVCHTACNWETEVTTALRISRVSSSVQYLPVINDNGDGSFEDGVKQSQWWWKPKWE